MKSIFNYLSLATIMIVCGAVGYAVYLKSLAVSQEAPPKPTPTPMVVEVTSLQQRAISDRVELVGSLEAVLRGQIKARAAGYIKKIPYDLGDFVEAGALVVELDNLKAREAFKESEAALKVAQAQRDSSLARERNLRTKLANYQELQRKNVLTRQQLEDLSSEHEVALAEVDLNRALVAQAESALETNRLILEETKIKSAFSGYVAERMCEVGDLADPNVPLLSVVNLDVIRTVVHIVERDYDKIKLGQRAVVRVDAYPGMEFAGKVIRIAPRIDLETRTAPIQIEIRNPEAYLKPGMYARVSLQFEEREHANVVPLATIQHDRDERFVFLVRPDDQTIERRNVRVGIEDAQYAEIREGLSRDDQIVALGSRLIREGDRVDPIPAPGDPESLSEPSPALDDFPVVTSE
jgi:RND family efflux transporter MFP subunit